MALAVAGASLLLPAEASAIRAFELGNPALGDISVGRVVMTVKPRAGTPPRVRGLRVVNAHRLPKRIFVAARIRRLGRSKQYIARVVILNRDRARASGRTPRTTIFDLIVNGTVRRSLFEDTRQVDVIGEPDVPDVCFFAQRDAEWTGFARLAGGPRMPRTKLDELTLVARDLLCGRPVREGFPEEFGTREPVTVFGGVHTPFHRARVEHVFRIHGNEDASGFSLDPPAGGAFIACTGPPCFIDAGRVFVAGPFPAGRDVELNARASVEIPPRVTATAYWGDGSGIFGGERMSFATRPFFP
jgi:hypothetical protein